VMGGLDCVVFTGGIGENFAEVCEWSCQGLEFLGLGGVDVQRATAEQAGGQQGRGGILEISAPESTVKVLIVPTNEELAIARDTFDLVSDL
jgi:acetate kinase